MSTHFVREKAYTQNTKMQIQRHKNEIATTFYSSAGIKPRDTHKLTNALPLSYSPGLYHNFIQIVTQLKGLVQNKNPSPKILRNSSTEIPSCAG
jgi:hypothetical protein